MRHRSKRPSNRKRQPKSDEEDGEAEPVQPKPVQPEPVQPEPVQPEPVQPEPVQPEPVQPEPQSNSNHEELDKLKRDMLVLGLDVPREVKALIPESLGAAKSFISNPGFSNLVARYTPTETRGSEAEQEPEPPKPDPKIEEPAPKNPPQIKWDVASLSRLFK